MKSLKMKFRFFFFIALLPALLFRCGEIGVNSFQESPLSDTPLTDPSLIRVNISVNKSTDLSGNTQQRVVAILRDKKNSPLKLKDGNVSVNGMSMEVVEDAILGIPIYNINKNILQVLPDSTYTFNITLADGKSYIASVKTREKNLTGLDLPAVHNKTQPLTVKWIEADARSPLKIETTRIAKPDSVNKSFHKEFYANNPGSGEYTFASAFFTEHVNTSKVYFKVVSEITGQMNNRFRSGSAISSEFSVGIISVEIQ